MTAPQNGTVSRPGSVTIVVVLTWISAVISIVSGVLILVAAPAGVRVAGSGGTALVVTVGVLVLILGLITAAVASRLGKGANWARLIVSAVQVLNIAAAIATLISSGVGSTVGSATVTIVIAVVILGLLWNSRANAFFAAH